MATNNSLTTFQGPIYENSQMNSTLNSNSSGSQSNFVNEVLLLPPNN